MGKRFMIVSPHPDDAELGMGGAIINAASKGHAVSIVDLTSGEPTPYGSEEKRKGEAQEADGILQISERVNLGLENRYLFDGKEARCALAERIRLFRPDILFCPYPEDAHPDHRAATRITEAARFYAKFTKVSLKGDPLYPPHLFYYFCSHLRIMPQFSFLADITEQFMEKMRAIRCYRSQFVDNPKNAFVFDYIEMQNRYLGMLIQTGYAEAIYSREPLRVDDMADVI
ncbi:MAG: PIG-L family deacetylase [bacterium]